MKDQKYEKQILLEDKHNLKDFNNQEFVNLEQDRYVITLHQKRKKVFLNLGVGHF